jgi:hypothetical protein
MYVTGQSGLTARGRVTVQMTTFHCSSGAPTGPGSDSEEHAGDSWLLAGCGEQDRRFLHNLKGALR